MRKTCKPAITALFILTGILISVPSFCHSSELSENNARSLLTGSGITVESVSPNTAMLGQNLSVTVTGTGFDASTRVFFFPDTGNRNKWIGQADTGDYAWGIAVSASTAYVADGKSGLQIMDISNPSAPRIAGIFDTPGTAYSVAVSGTLACVADGDGGLQIVNVSNPSAPALISTMDPYTKDIWLVGNTLFAVGSSFRVINISNPASPQVSGTLAVKGERIFAADSKAYITDGNGLHIIDISNLSAPRSMGFADTPGFASGIAVSGDFAYVTNNDSHPDQMGSLQIINISVPETPRIVSSLSLNRPSDVRISGNTAYVTNFTNGLSMADVSNPADPFVTGCINIPGESEKLSVSGDFVYVADGRCGLRILNITHTDRMFIGSMNSKTQLIWGGEVEGNVLYMTDPYVRDLNAIDVSDPSVPRLLSNPGTNSALYLPLDVAVSGNTAYMLTGESMEYGNFHVMDVSNPTKIKFLHLSHFLDIPSDTSGGITADGNMVYAVNAEGNVQVIDVSEPYRPYLRNLLETPGDTVGIFVAGNILYTTNRDTGMQILDIRNPSVPLGTFGIPEPYNPFGICVQGNIAYIATSFSSILVIDISDPSDLHLMGILDTFDRAMNVDVKGNRVYAADDENLLILPAPAEALQLSVSSSANLTAIFPSPQMAGHYNLWVSSPGGNAEKIGAVFYTIPNDNYANASLLAGTQGQVISSNINATRETNEPAHANKTVRRSLWWKISPGQSGTVFADTQGSEFDTLMSVYTGTSLGNLNKIADNDDCRTDDHSSGLSFDVQAGTTYYIAVDGYNGSCGKTVLNWKLTALSPPSNDVFENASILKISAGQTICANTNAQKQTGEPYHADKEGGRSLWWTWIPDKAGTVLLNTQGSAFDTVLGVYTGTDLNHLTLLAANDNSDGLTSGVSFQVSTGQQYFIAVDGSSISEFGKTVLNWQENIFPAPGNDDFVNAYELNGDMGNTNGTNVNATREAGEPDHIYKTGGNSVWWKWTAPRNGELFLDTEGSGFDTVISVYTGSSINDLKKMADNDDSSDIPDENQHYSGLSLEVAAGEQYYIAITGFDSSEGNIVLNWEQKGLTLKTVLPVAGSTDKNFENVILTGSGFDANTTVYLTDNNQHRYDAVIAEKTSVRMKVSFSAPFVAGYYDLTVSNGTESSTLSSAVVFVLPQDANLFENKAIIVAAADGPGPNIREEIRWVGDTAYNALLQQGYTPEDIWYFTPETDSEGRDDDPTFQNLLNIFDYLVTSPPYSLIVYFAGHGEDGAFWINETEKITAVQTDTWLDTLQQVMAGNVIFVYDACNSGTFVRGAQGNPVLSPPENKERIVISSSLPEETAVFADYGSLSFSNYFWTSIGNGKTVDWAFRFSAKKLEDYQTPMIDSNGNGISGENQDHLIASVNLGMGEYDPQTPRPSIESVTAQLPLIQAKVTDAGGIAQVWAVVIPPNQDIDSEPIIITLGDTDGNGIYEGSYNDFNMPGTYAVIIHAVNVQGNNASPQYAVFTQTNGTVPDDYGDMYEPDDTWENATLLIPGDAVQAHNFHKPGDEDWLEFNGIADTTYKIAAANPSLICQAVIEIYEKDTNVPVDQIQGIPGESIALYLRVQQNRSYLIRLKNADSGIFGKNVRYELSISVAEGGFTQIIYVVVADSSGQYVKDATVYTKYTKTYSNAEQFFYIYSDGTYKIMKHPTGEYILEVSAPGYKTYCNYSIQFREDESKTIFVELKTPGLSDAINVLKTVSGITVTDISCWKPDLSGDGRIGMEDAIFLLQQVAEIR